MSQANYERVMNFGKKKGKLIILTLSNGKVLKIDTRTYNLEKILERLEKANLKIVKREEKNAI